MVFVAFNCGQNMVVNEHVKDNTEWNSVFLSVKLEKVSAQGHFQLSALPSFQVFRLCD